MNSETENLRNSSCQGVFYIKFNRETVYFVSFLNTERQHICIMATLQKAVFAEDLLMFFFFT